MNNGWVKLHRKLLDNPQLANDNTACLLFIKLILVTDSRTGSYTTGRFRLSELANEKPTTIYKALKRLEKWGMIELVSNSKMTTVRLCNFKDYQETSNNKVTTKGQQSNNTVTLNKNKEERIKNITNVIGDTPKTPSIEINEMFSYWNEILGYEISSKKQANRYACSNLLKKYGAAGVKQLIMAVSSAQSDQYAPRVSDFSSLQSKLNELVAWAKKKGNSNATARF